MAVVVARVPEGAGATLGVVVAVVSVIAVVVVGAWRFGRTAGHKTDKQKGRRTDRHTNAHPTHNLD